MRRLAVLLVVIFCGNPGCADADEPTGSAAPTTLVAPYRSEVYADPAHWLCLSDRTDDVCARPLDATDVAADGTLTPQPFTRATDPPIDCFYVYPTISDDPAPNADLQPNATEQGVTEQQFARFGSVCRTFAPVYRQVPLAAIFGATPGPEARELAYADVRDAWRHYLANDNRGRGVVLIGHSQGAGHLNRLIKEEIDPQPAIRRILVSALLLGATVAVPDGADVGGDFANIALCRSASQTGCVVTYASFDGRTPPGPDSLFGRPRSGPGVGSCTDPAALDGSGAGRPRGYFRTDAKLLAPALTATISTPYVTFGDWVTSGCKVSDAGSRYLAIGFPSAGDVRPLDVSDVPTPAWGLHLIDVNVALGTLVDLVRSQATAHAR